MNPVHRAGWLVVFVLATLVHASVALAFQPDDQRREMPEGPRREVIPVPAELRETWKLAAFYEKCVLADGLPVLGSRRVADEALLEAAYLVDLMLANRDDVRRAMIVSKTRLAVMAASERTTDIPEHGDLQPASHWDRRARGLGATNARPAVSCGEENLLELRGDPYRGESILIHEFAHALHSMGLNNLDRKFDDRLKQTYQRALQAGLWEGTYAATNHHEYWAEGVQSFFDTNRANDSQHNHVDTREKLKQYDPDLAALIEETLGPSDWRYVPPRQRTALRHLETFDRSTAPRFSWQDRVVRDEDESP